MFLFIKIDKSYYFSFKNYLEFSTSIFLSSSKFKKKPILQKFYIISIICF